MKLKITQNTLQDITKAGLFLCVIAIIAQLFPTENKFKYQFEVGKPWSYELITAAFDFPIYKNQQEVTAERDELLKNYIPYFQIDTNTIDVQFKKLISDYTGANGNAPLFQDYIRRKLNAIYSKGIISSEEYNKLKEAGKTNLNCILPNRVTRQLAISDVFTPKTAYEEILRDAPDTIKSYNLNLYLVENLKYDSAASELYKKDLLKNISLTSGMVQTGERIIDRGEIVTPELYVILNSLKTEYQKRKAFIQQSTLVIIGEIIIITILIVLFFLYLHLFRPRIFDNFGNLFFMCLLILMMVGMTALTLKYPNLNYYMVPFALLPIIIRVFFDSRTALFAHIITMLIISFMVDNPFQFIILQIAIGMIAVSSLKDMTQRSQLAQTALYIFLSYVFIYIAFEFISEGEIRRIHLQPIIYFGISSGFLLFAYILIYIFEKIFNLISAVTLVELTNVNSDLMMRFAEVAPGTFQHTLQVSNLATEAAKKIGANSLLVRTGALYHDIGKMRHPEYFIENQMGGKNPLAEMDFEVASRIVIGHVKDGVEIAKKSHLPEQIIHFITTHHGRGKTKYFYNSFINANPDKIPNEEAYTYPGPLPNSKETAILMMADAVEARSRSLSIYTEESINTAVEQMIDLQIADGQFKDAPISFRDVETVKSVFKEKIKNIYHTRIVYPEINNK
ncbi:MAG: HDIG domain-containing protein [Bacteroidales bacterium]|nr:HDIG domain-containing protein [Bacteroidales bacterium]